MHGTGYEIVWEETRNRQLGRNKTPAGIRVQTRHDALALIGRTAVVARFDTLAQATLGRYPSLHGWLARTSLMCSTTQIRGSRFSTAPPGSARIHAPGLYTRQIHEPGVHTKLIEARKAVLAELLDLVLPPEAIEPSAAGTRGFEVGYGLRAKPALVRFRILDDRHTIAGLTDLTVPTEQFAALSLGITHVFVVETTLLASPFRRCPTASSCSASAMP